MKPNYSALTPGTLDGFGLSLSFLAESSIIVNPLPKYFLMKFIYSSKVMYLSSLLLMIWKTFVKRSYSGLNLKKNVLSRMIIMNCWRLNFIPWVSYLYFLLMTISTKKIYRIMATNSSKVANFYCLASNLK